MYQFSEVAKRTDCVIFESVGSRSNNEGMVVQVRVLSFKCLAVSLSVLQAAESLGGPAGT